MFFLELVDSLSPQNALLLTSGNTGNPALREINAGLVPNLISHTYIAGRELDEHKHGSSPARTLEVVKPLVKSGAPYDLTFVDPFHSYASRIEALTLALESTPQGWVLVHDCLPRFAIAGEQETDGEWCGSTFAAFYDLMRSGENDRAWFVINADFGIGVVAPHGTAHSFQDTVTSDVIAAWSSANLAEKRKFLLGDNHWLFRAIDSVSLGEALDCIIGGRGPFALPNLTENLKRELEARSHELRALVAKNAEIEMALQSMRESIAEAQRELAFTKSSRSWKLTAPYRALGTALRTFTRASHD